MYRNNNSIFKKGEKVNIEKLLLEKKKRQIDSTPWQRMKSQMIAEKMGNDANAYNMDIQNVLKEREERHREFLIKNSAGQKTNWETFEMEDKIKKAKEIEESVMNKVKADKPLTIKQINMFKGVITHHIRNDTRNSQKLEDIVKDAQKTGIIRKTHIKDIILKKKKKVSKTNFSK